MKNSYMKKTNLTTSQNTDDIQTKYCGTMIKKFLHFTYSALTQQRTGKTVLFLRFLQHQKKKSETDGLIYTHEMFCKNKLLF